MSILNKPPYRNFWGLLTLLARENLTPLIMNSAPVDGTSGSGAASSAPGGLLLDIGTQNLFINVGTKASPVWNCVTEDSIQAGDVTIATTSTTDIYFVATRAGSLASIDFTSLAALAAHDTNYITFSLTNLGQAGSGTAVMLAATDANTTKVTGGTALVASSRRALTLTSTAADLVVAKGDVLRFRATASGTLAGTVTRSTVQARFRNS